MFRFIPVLRIVSAFSLAAAFALLGASCDSPLACEGSECRDLIVNGSKRTYRLHVPSNFQPGSGALVVVLAGSDGTGAGMERVTKMSAKADTAGFAVAYPYSTVAPGTNTTEWHNYFDDELWEPGVPPDDVAFMRALVSDVGATVHPDPQRIYFTGISNGGLFAHRVGIEMSDVVAAIGIVEGTLYGFGGEVEQIPAAMAPVSVLIFHGDADEVIPYCVQNGLASQQVTYDYWINTPAMSCQITSTSAPLCEANGDISSLSEKTDTRCDGGAEVQFYKLIGGVHTWYTDDMNVDGHAPYNPAFDSATGVTTDDILWSYFSAHPKT